jgi:hypothetical protein
MNVQLIAGFGKAGEMANLRTVLTITDTFDDQDRRTILIFTDPLNYVEFNMSELVAAVKCLQEADGISRNAKFIKKESKNDIT